VSILLSRRCSRSPCSGQPARCPSCCHGAVPGLRVQGSLHFLCVRAAPRFAGAQSADCVGQAFRQRAQRRLGRQEALLEETQISFSLKKARNEYNSLGSVNSAKTYYCIALNSYSNLKKKGKIMKTLKSSLRKKKLFLEPDGG